MHSSKICNLCSNNFKKQKATEADPCFISNDFKPFYDPNLEPFFFKIILLNYYSRQGKHLVDDNIKDANYNRYIKYIEYSSYYYIYSAIIRMEVHGKHYELKTHKLVQPETDNLYGVFYSFTNCSIYLQEKI